MSRGIIYFIQPSELVGTNRYKIGCSRSPDLDRCKNGYKKGSRYIFIMECIDPLVLEKNIINEFNKLFKLIAGNEYFEGDEIVMKKTFLKIFEDYENKNNKIVLNQTTYENKNNDKVNNINKIENENNLNNLVTSQTTTEDKSKIKNYIFNMRSDINILNQELNNNCNLLIIHNTSNNEYKEGQIFCNTMNEKTYNCDKCLCKTFKNLNGLHKHQNKMHQCNQLITFNCSKCNKNFNCRQHKWRHEKNCKNTRNIIFIN